MAAVWWWWHDGEWWQRASPQLPLQEATVSAPDGATRDGLTPLQWLERHRTRASTAVMLTGHEAHQVHADAVPPQSQKRRRVSSKRGLLSLPPAHWDELGVEAYLTRESAAAPELAPARPTSGGVTSAARLAVKNAARLQYLADHRMQLKAAYEQAMGEQPNKEQLRSAAARGFHGLSSADKLKVYARLKAEKLDGWQHWEALEELMADQAKAGGGTPTRYWFQGMLLLVTMQGPWGVVPDADLQALGQAKEYTQELAVTLKAHVWTRVLWRLLVEWTQRMARELRLKGWSCSLEVCLQTLQETGEVRLHGHAALEAMSFAARMRLWAPLVFLGGQVNCGASDGPGNVQHSRGRQVHRAVGSLHYYAQAPKRGQLFNDTSRPVHGEVLVSPEDILQLYRQGKMGPHDAKREFALCGRDVKRWRQQVDEREQALQEDRLRVHMVEVQQRLRAKDSPFKLYKVIIEWRGDFGEWGWRKKFLVLEGPSEYGKTHFGLAIDGPEKTLEVNCARCVEPNLRELLQGPAGHTAVLLDEAKATMILGMKKLVQGPPALVGLASSGTNCHAYSVWVHNVKMIVCSNTWSREISELHAEDAWWLIDNSVHLTVDDRLWHA